MKKNGTLLVFCIILFVLCSIQAFAVPAYPYKVKVVTGNGKTAAIYVCGDESQKYGVTEDGYTLISDSLGWWYAYQTNAGLVKRSNFNLMAPEDETVELKQFKAGCPKGILPERAISVPSGRHSSPNRVNVSGPIVGERRALVILMQYKDVAFKKTKDDFEALFNTLEYHQNGATGSVRDFYRFASQGQLDYISDVYGPYTAQNPMRYYGSNNINGGKDKNPLELCIEAIKCLPNDIDYSIYDNNGDGLVDNVHIIYAGYGEEAGASSDAIWAHEYPHRINLKNEVGYSFEGYSCSPELRGNGGSNITHIGVICHELGHALGAMDYYDTNYGTGGEFIGTGKWDIMAGGSWNDDGRTPPNFNPYVRSTVFGWNQQITLEVNQSITMPRIELDNAEQTVIYRVNTGSEGDYFLLENRQKHHFDAALPGAGLMVYHIHPNIDRYNSTNTINATSPQGLYPVCASYSEPSKKKYGNINSAECPFPGSKNIRAFTPTTSPAAVAWNGSAAKVSISHITLNSSDGSISFKTSEEVIDEPDEPDLPTKKNLIYQESFETNIAGRMDVKSITGKEMWRTYTKGNFVMNADAIPEATDGEKLLMLFAGKGSVMNESEAVSNNIEVEAGDNYTISFDIYCEVNSTIAPTFNLYVEDEYGEYNIYSLNEAVTQWKTIELPLSFAGSYFRYKLYGRVHTGGIFIDNIRLYKEQEMTSVNDFSIIGEQPIELYRLNGIRLGEYNKVGETLPPGIYIVRQGKQAKKKIIK